MPSLQQSDLSDISDHDSAYFEDGEHSVSAVRVLGKGLKDCSGLARLNLSDNFFTDDDMVSVMFYLKRMSWLQELKLDGNDLSAPGLSALIPWLEELTTLQILDMSHADVTDHSKVALNGLSKKLPSLRRFCMSGVHILPFDSSFQLLDT